MRKQPNRIAIGVEGRGEVVKSNNGSMLNIRWPVSSHQENPSSGYAAWLAARCSLSALSVVTVTGQLQAIKALNR